MTITIRQLEWRDGVAGSPFGRFSIQETDKGCVVATPLGDHTFTESKADKGIRPPVRRTGK